MKTQYGCVQMCTSDTDYENFLKENEWEGVHACSNGMLMWGKKKRDAACFSPTPKQIGAYVLAYSRKMVDDFINAINPARMQLVRNAFFLPPMHATAHDGDVITVQMARHKQLMRQAIDAQPRTGDTDSLIIHANQVMLAYDAGLLGDTVGKWTCDLNKRWYWHATPVMALIWEYYGPAPKSYAFVYSLPRQEMSSDGSVEIYWDPFQRREKVRFKGIPKSVPIEFEGMVFEHLDFSFFRRVVVALASRDETDDAFVPPQAEISSMYRVGYRASAADMQRGNRPFTLQPLRITRRMFANMYTGRKVWDTTALGGDATAELENSQLVPRSFTGYAWSHDSAPSDVGMEDADDMGTTA